MLSLALRLLEAALCVVLLFCSDPQRSLSPEKSTASAAVRMKSRMTENSSSQPVLLSCGGAACSPLHLVQITRIRTVQAASSLGLPTSHILLVLVNVMSQRDVVDGAEGGGRDKATRL